MHGPEFSGYPGPDKEPEEMHKQLDEIALFSDYDLEEMLGELLETRALGERVDENKIDMIKHELHFRRFPEE